LVITPTKAKLAKINLPRFIGDNTNKGEKRRKDDANLVVNQ